VDKTEFRNVKFDKSRNLSIERIFENIIEKGSFKKCFLLIFLLLLVWDPQENCVNPE
jgi:hypothetical protein